MSASSAVSPEFDKARIASSEPIMPRSPWLASAGWTNCAGVPVEASVAAILRRDMAALADPGDDQPPAHRGADIEGERRTSRRASAPMLRARRFRRGSPAGRPRCPAAAAAPLQAASARSMPHRADMAIAHPPKHRPRDRDHCTQSRRPPPAAASMREDVLLRPALEIKQNAMRQEIEAGSGPARVASLARQHRVESGAQRVQVQHVGGGVAQLLFGQ